VWKKHPESGTAAALRAYLLQRCGRPAEALAAAEELARRTPTDEQVLSTLTLVWRACGRPEVRPPAAAAAAAADAARSSPPPPTSRLRPPAPPTTRCWPPPSSRTCAPASWRCSSGRRQAALVVAAPMVELIAQRYHSCRARRQTCCLRSFRCRRRAWAWADA